MLQIARQITSPDGRKLMPLLPKPFLPGGYFLAVTSGINVYAGGVAGDGVKLWIAEFKKHPSDFA